MGAGRARVSLMRCPRLLAHGEASPLMRAQAGCTALPGMPPTPPSAPPSPTPEAHSCSRPLSSAKVTPLCPVGEKDVDKILHLTFWVNAQIPALVFLFVKMRALFGGISREIFRKCLVHCAVLNDWHMVGDFQRKM